MAYTQRPPITERCKTVDPGDHVGHGHLRVDNRTTDPGYDVGCADLTDVEVRIAQRLWDARV